MVSNRNVDAASIGKIGLLPNTRELENEFIMALFMKRWNCETDHSEQLGVAIVIDRDGWPLEQFKNRPVSNFLRRLIHGDHRECRECYRCRTSVRVE